MTRPARNLPLGRVFVLLGIGFFIYGRFDAILESVGSGFLKIFPSPQAALSRFQGTFRQPLQKDISTHIDSVFHKRWSGDSSRVDLECSLANFTQCYSWMDSLSSGLGGISRSLFHKWHIMNRGKKIHSVTWSANLPVFSSGVTQPGNAPLSFQLNGFRIVGDQGAWNYTARFPKSNEDQGSVIEPNVPKYCMASGKCLGDASWAWPLDSFRILDLKENQDRVVEVYGHPHPEQIVWMAAGHGQSFRPVWTGKVVAMNSQARMGNKITMYHGKGLFSHYTHFMAIDTAVALGRIISSDQVIGFLGNTQDTLREARKVIALLGLSIEVDGMFVDPKRLIEMKAAVGFSALD